MNIWRYEPGGKLNHDFEIGKVGYTLKMQKRVFNGTKKII